jgi:D-lactate dehydrogenase
MSRRRGAAERPDEIKARAPEPRSGVPLTFRAAGTSLSGQAVGGGVIVDCSRHWRTLEILDGGARVRVGPGVVGGMVNAHLAAYCAKLGPDPASIGACMIGGIVANNSSGMCCGIENNAYRTLLRCASCSPPARSSSRRPKPRRRSPRGSPRWRPVSWS